MFWLVAAGIVAVAAALGYWSDWRDRRAGRHVAVGDLREVRRDVRAIGANPVVNSALGTRWMGHGRQRPNDAHRDPNAAGDTAPSDADD